MSALGTATGSAGGCPVLESPPAVGITPLANLCSNQDQRDFSFIVLNSHFSDDWLTLHIPSWACCLLDFLFFFKDFFDVDPSEIFTKFVAILFPFHVLVFWLPGM